MLCCSTRLNGLRVLAFPVRYCKQAQLVMFDGMRQLFETHIEDGKIYAPCLLLWTTFAALPKRVKHVFME
jgi:hypothetical protein